MSVPIKHVVKDGYDSDATYCSEVERYDLKRNRKQTKLFEAKSSAIEKLEQQSGKIKKQSISKEEKQEKLMKLAKAYKIKNRADANAVEKLISEMTGLQISAPPSNKRYSVKGKTVQAKVKTKVKGFSGTNSGTGSDFIKTEHDFPKSEAYKTNQNVELEKVSMDAHFQESNTNNHDLSISNIFVDPQVKKIIVHSDIKIINSQQNVFDKYSPGSDAVLQMNNTLNEFDRLEETQTEGINIIKNDTIQASSGNNYTTKAKENITSDSTQSTIENYSSQNNEENKNQTTSQIDEEMVIDNKDKMTIPPLSEVIKAVGDCKKRFIIRLQAKREEILKLRAIEASRKKEEISCSSNFVGRNSRVVACPEISEADLLKNMQDLQEISEHYKKKYKNMGINLFD